MIIFEIEQRSEAWYTARAGRVTGTRFQNLVSKESTDSYKNLVTNIACEIITGVFDETYKNDFMEEAQEKEVDARKEYESVTGIKLATPGFIIPDEDHPFHEWIGVSPDGLYGRGGLEVKCPLNRTHMDYIMENRLPTEYRHQVQGSLFVTGLDYWDFMSYAEGMKPFIVRVLPDEELFNLYTQRLLALIADVQDKIMNYKKYDYHE